MTSSDDADADDDRLLAEGELGRLVARHIDDLRTVALLRVGRDRADDLVQIALLRTVTEYRRGRRWPVPFRVVVHQHLRWAIGDLAGERRDPGLPDGWDVVDPAAEDAYEHLAARLDVGRVLERLPPRDREVMMLRVLEGRSPAQIADHLGMTRNAVDQALWRGRRSLGEAWPGG